MNINVPRLASAGRRAVGGGPRPARSERAVLQHVRHAALSRRGVGAVLARGICAALRGAARQDARARSRRRDRAGRPEPLELRRRHDLAHRPLGVARDLVLRGGAARGRADADLLHGRHPCRSGAPPGRAGARRRAPEPRRPLCRGDGRAHQGARHRKAAHRPRRDRSRATRTTCR